MSLIMYYIKRIIFLGGRYNFFFFFNLTTTQCSQPWSENMSFADLKEKTLFGGSHVSGRMFHWVQKEETLSVQLSR